MTIIVDEEGKQIAQPPPPKRDRLKWLRGNTLLDWVTFFTAIGVGVVAYFDMSYNRAQAETARDTEIHQLRAYFHYEIADFDGFYVDGVPTFKFTFKNVGQTPAYNVRGDTTVGMREWPLSPSAKFPVNPDKQVSGVEQPMMVTSDESTWDGTLKSKIPEQNYYAALNGEKFRLYIAVRMLYDDAFGSHCERKIFLSARGSDLVAWRNDAVAGNAAIMRWEMVGGMNTINEECR